MWSRWPCAHRAERPCDLACRGCGSVDPSLVESAGEARGTTRGSERFGGADFPRGSPDDVGRDREIGSPCRVDHQRSSSEPGSHPGRDDLALDRQFGGRPSVDRGFGARCEQWPVRDADRREVEDRAQVERQPRPSRMIASGRVHQEDVRRTREGPDGPLEHRAFAQCHVPGMVGRPRASADDGLSYDPAFVEADGCCPRGLSSSLAGASGWSREPHPGDRRGLRW